jgi:hypothetical protein
MGMVRLVGMSLLVFVWVEFCFVWGWMMKVGWKDRASIGGAERKRFTLDGCFSLL